MRMKITAAMTALALAGATMLAVTPANARWRHHHGGGGAAIAGFAAGAILGGVLASQQPYYYGPTYGPAYAYEGRSVGYCEQRFKSYDPESGTYLGYDGYRHPCP